jgi:hypothetical protein
VNQPGKLDVPLDDTTRVLYIIRYGHLLKAGNAKQTNKNFLKSSIPTPNILPKVNYRALARIKSNMAPKNLPTLTNVFSETHPMRPRDVL